MSDQNIEALNPTTITDLVHAIYIERPDIQDFVITAGINTVHAETLIAGAFAKHWYVETQEWETAGKYREIQIAARKRIESEGIDSLQLNELNEKVFSMFVHTVN